MWNVAVAHSSDDAGLMWSMCYIHLFLIKCQRASLIAQLKKNLPATQETWVRFLSQEDPVVKEMATHCGILACRIPWTEEPGRLQSMGSQELDMT